jgi:HSP90 family molecular chaperone
LSQIAEKDTEKYQKIIRIYGNTLKLGAIEDEKWVQELYNEN